MQRVLHLVISRAFFQQNIGFFLVVLVVGGAFMRAEEHLALAKYAVYSLPFLAIFFMSLWMLYTLKVMQFVVKSISDPRQEFLYLLRLVSIPKQISLWLMVHLTMLLPVLFYSFFVISQAIRFQVWLPVFVILIFLILILAIPIWLYIWATKHPNRSQNFLIFNSVIQFQLPYSLFYIRHLIADQKMLLFLTKSFTCLVLIGVCVLYPTDQYDGRLIGLGILIVAFAHTVLIFPFHSFEQRHLLILKNLPVSNLKRFVYQAFVFALLLIPEVIVLFRFWPNGLGIVLFFQAICLGFGLLLLIHSYLYFRPDQDETFAWIVFWAFMAVFFLIMFEVPFEFQSAVYLVTSYFLFTRNYFSVEYREET